MTFAEQLQRFISPLREKVMSMIGCAIIQAVKDDGKLQLIKSSMLRDELKEGVERIQEYGFTSNPPKGSEAVVVFPQGNREFGLIIATDSSRYRLKNLPEGAMAIYNKNGDYVKLTEGKIEVHAAEIILGDGSGFKKLVNEEFQDMFNNHVHQFTDIIYPAGTPSVAVTGGPASVSGTGGSDPGVNPMVDPALGVSIGSNELTSKTKAE